MFLCVELVVDEHAIDDLFRLSIGQPGSARNQLEAPLHPLKSICERRNEVNMLGMLRKDPFEISREGHVVTTKNSHFDSDPEAHGSVVGAPRVERKESIAQHLEVEDSEDRYPVLADCVLFLHDVDMPEGERFEERIHH